jgi:hypothetical protein
MQERQNFLSYLALENYSVYVSNGGFVMSLQRQRKDEFHRKT